MLDMNPRRIFAIVLRQLYILRGSPTRVMPIFLWAFLDIVLWGFISKFLMQMPGTSAILIGTLLGAVILQSFFTRIMQGMTMAFFEDVWTQNFLNVFASPLTLGEYVFGLGLTSVMTTAVSFAAMLLVALFFFGFSFAGYGLALFAFLMVLFLTGIAFSIVSIGIVLRFGPSAEWLIWPIPAILTPLVGVFYPISILPVWLQWVSHVLPPTYVFEGIRSVVTAGVFSPQAFVIASLLAIVYIALAYWFLVWIYRKALRSGLISRYSAESV